MKDSKSNFFLGLGQLFFNINAKSTETTDESIVAGGQSLGLGIELHESIANLKSQLDSRKQARGQVSDNTARMQSDEDREIQRKAEWLEEAGQRRSEMLQEILRLHTVLGTGLCEKDLQSLYKEMHELAATFSSFNAGSLDDRVRHSTVRLLLKNTGELAWNRLQALIQANPESGWLVKSTEDPGASADDSGRQLKYLVDEQRQLFINSNPESFADLITGEVDAWKYDYPAPKSELGRSVALRAVASGIKARLLRAAIQRIQISREEIWAEIRKLMDKEQQAINQCVARGVGSLEQADQLISAVNNLLDTVAPEIVWEFIDQDIIPVA